jgi:multicomponent Na+:H+ antiporter subunit E
MRFLKYVVPITLLYLALTANLEPLNWVLGIVLAVGITALIRPNPTPIIWRSLPLALLAAVRFGLVLFWELLVTGFQVARLVVSPKIDVQQGIVAIPSSSQSAATTVASAHAITLTPGEMVIEIDEKGVMYTHTLDAAHSAENGPASQARRAAMLDKAVG